MDRNRISVLGFFYLKENKMKSKEYIDTRKSVEFIVKGGKKAWNKYLERLKKAKEKGCISCDNCK